MNPRLRRAAATRPGAGPMPAGFRRCVMVAPVGAAVLLGTPGAAFAHGVGGTSDTASGFVWLGLIHMLLGWDHLLFIAGVVLLGGQVKRSAKLISVFAVGHSGTLIVATLAGWRLNATMVDIVIALSLAFVGVIGWAGRPTRWRWFAAAVLGFGLVHGLGLSTRLQELGVHHDATLARLIAFNIGVEIGQLLAVLGMFMLPLDLAHQRRWVAGPWAAGHQPAEAVRGRGLVRLWPGRSLRRRCRVERRRRGASY